MSELASNESAREATAAASGAADALTAEGFDAAELYAAVKPCGNEPELTANTERLKPTLRPYQKRAAAWMVAREKALQVGLFDRPEVSAHQDHTQTVAETLRSQTRASQQLLKSLPAYWQWPLHALTPESNVDYWSV